MSDHLVILGTAREDSHTQKFISKIFSDYELVNLLDYEIDHYVYSSKGVLEDDFIILVEAMVRAKTITFATPVYWYAMSGRMKVFFDRFSELISRYKNYGRALKGKEVNLIVTGNDKELPEGFEVPFRRTAEYFGMRFLKTYYECTGEN